MKEKDYVNVYWSPHSTYEDIEIGEWNMLYSDPTTLFEDLYKLKTKDAGNANYFTCPATSKQYQKTFVFKNELESKYKFDFSSSNPEENYFLNEPGPHLSYEIIRRPTITTGPMVGINMYYVFFSDEPLKASFTPPMMHPPKYTKYGTVIPGSFDIGQWFRPFHLEMQMWNNKGELKLENQEPLFYVSFDTEKKVKLQRFKMTGAANSYLRFCSSTRKVWGLDSSLEERYKRFKRTRMRELILKEIKENLLDEYNEGTLCSMK
jgi:hypothetical protein